MHKSFQLADADDIDHLITIMADVRVPWSLISWHGVTKHNFFICLHCHMCIYLISVNQNGSTYKFVLTCVTNM